MSAPKFCASCTRDFAPGDQRHLFDGAVICTSCNGGPRLITRTPEHLQRGYESRGTAGDIKQMVNAAHTRIHGASTKGRQKMGLSPVRDSVEPGHNVVRLPKRDAAGKPLDKYEAKQQFGDDSLIHVASTMQFHVFQRPAPKAESAPNPLLALEPYRRKS